MKGFSIKVGSIDIVSTYKDGWYTHALRLHGTITKGKEARSFTFTDKGSLEVKYYPSSWGDYEDFADNLVAHLIDKVREFGEDKERYERV